MKTHILTLILLLGGAFTANAQQTPTDIYRLDYIKTLGKEEIYRQYAYDDTSRALITKFYSSNKQAAVLAGVGSVLTAGVGTVTYSVTDMVLSGRGGLGVIYLLPVAIVGVVVTGFCAAGTVSSVVVIESKGKLLDSLIYYKEKGVLRTKDRRWIRSYLPKPH